MSCLSVLRGLKQLTVSSAKVGRGWWLLPHLLHKFPHLTHVSVPLEANSSSDLSQTFTTRTRSLIIQAKLDVKCNGVDAVRLLTKCTALTGLELRMVTPQKLYTLPAGKADAVLDAVASLTRLRSLAICGDLKCSVRVHPRKPYYMR